MSKMSKKTKPSDVVAVRYVNGYRGGKVKPAVAFREIEKIKARHKGRVTADVIVDAARPVKGKPAHPLQKQFEWDDTVAGEEYRKEQARRLVRSIVVEYRDAPEVPIRAYHVTTEPVHADTGERAEINVYRSTDDILSDPDARAALLGRALRELLSYQRRFRGLQELAPVFRSLDEVLQTVEIPT